MRTNIPEKLFKIIEEIDERGSANLTRLTVLKKWFERPERLSAFAVWIAARATSRKGKTGGAAAVIVLGLVVAGCLAGVIFINDLAARVMFVVFGVLPGLGITLVWKRHRRGELTLNAEGVFYSGWKQNNRNSRQQRRKCPIRHCNLSVMPAKSSPRPRQRW